MGNGTEQQDEAASHGCQRAAKNLVAGCPTASSQFSEYIFFQLYDLGTCMQPYRPVCPHARDPFMPISAAIKSSPCFKEACICKAGEVTSSLLF